jgi:hypothetical protein
MKIENRKKRVFCCVIFCVSFFSLAAAAFPQSGKSETNTPIQEITVPTDNKPKDEIPRPKANYEYLAPQNIRDFMLALKEAGKRGFRLDKLTTLSGTYVETSQQKASATVLAGIVKFDGESRYDYNFFFAEGEDDPEQTLNALSKEGWAFRDLISAGGTGDASSLPIEDIFANRLRKFPTLGNIYVLERTDGKKTARTYKLLKAGVGTGRNPTPKLQSLLDQAVTEGFVPVGTYFSFDIKSLFSVDSFSGILVEKRDDGAKLEYKFVRGNHSNGMWKDIDTFAKQGFHIGVMSFSTAVLAREPGNTAPVSYTWLETEGKTYQTDLAAALAKNLSFHSTGTYTLGMADFNKNLMIFENNSPAIVSELRFVRMVSIIPKQFKKNPQDYLKTLEKPDVSFQKALDEGFTPQDVYFSENEGLVVVFTRKKNQ